MNSNDIAPRLNQGAATQGEATALLGEFSALLRRLGAPPIEGVAAGAASVCAMLDSYQTAVLAPIELPAIARAYQHAARGHWRELLLLDSSLAAEPLLQPFAAGSRQIGRMHLERLRPLRDERLARRYLAATESGQAHGWHTVVYGVMLAIYSLPLRQGLIHYARETMAGLAAASRGAVGALDEEALRAAVENAVCDLNGAQVSSIASP